MMYKLLMQQDQPDSLTFDRLHIPASAVIYGTASLLSSFFDTIYSLP